MEKKYIMALDQGTTSSRAIIFDKDQNIVATAQKEFTQFYPHEGWVEHDAMEIYSSQYGVMVEAIVKSGINPEEIAGIGITNQRGCEGYCCYWYYQSERDHTGLGSQDR